MSGLLAVGLVAIGAAIGLGWAAATSRPGNAGTAQQLASIDEVYARDFGGATASSPLLVPLSGPMLGLRAVAARFSSGNARMRIQHHLDVAGNTGRWTPERILAFKGLGLLCGGVGGLLVGLGSAGLVLVLPAVGAVAGFFLPDVLLYNTGTKRQARLQRALPDALDMMTVCVEAGLGFDASLAQVARNTAGPLAAECARVLQEMQFGKSRLQALRSMADRTTVAELRMLVSALVQASELGIPVATVLREQAQEMRVRRRQRAEESAQKVTVKILVPLIFCLFPALMIIVIGPGAMSIAGLTFG
jgi:tight adherence protein C